MKKTQCAEFADEFIAINGQPESPVLYRMLIMEAWTMGYIAGIDKSADIMQGKPEKAHG